MAGTRRARTEDQLVARRAGGAQGEEVARRGRARLACGWACLARPRRGIRPGAIRTEGGACVAHEVGLVGGRDARCAAARVGVCGDGGRHGARGARVSAWLTEVGAIRRCARWAHRVALAALEGVACVGTREARARTRAITRGAARVTGRARAAAVTVVPGGTSGQALTTEQVGPEPWLRVPVARLVLLRDRRHAPHRSGVP